MSLLNLQDKTDMPKYNILMGLFSTLPLNKHQHFGQVLKDQGIKNPAVLTLKSCYIKNVGQLFYLLAIERKQSASLTFSYKHQIYQLDKAYLSVNDLWRVLLQVSKKTRFLYL